MWNLRLELVGWLSFFFCRTQPLLLWLSLLIQSTKKDSLIPFHLLFAFTQILLFLGNPFQSSIQSLLFGTQFILFISWVYIYSLLFLCILYIFLYVDLILFFFVLIRFCYLRLEANILALIGRPIIFALISLDSFGDSELRSSIFPTLVQLLCILYFVLGSVLLRVIYKNAFVNFF